MTKLRFIKQRKFGINNYIKNRNGIASLEFKVNVTRMTVNGKRNHKSSLCRN